MSTNNGVYLTPKKNWLLVEPAEINYPSELVVPDAASQESKMESYDSFKVLATGPDVTTVKPGDEIIVEGMMAVAQFKYKDETYMACNEETVAFIVERRMHDGG